MTETVQQLDQAINQGRISQAVSLGEALFQASPDNQHIALSLSEAYRQAGETALAKSTAMKAFDISPDFPFAQAQYLRCLLPYADHNAMTAVLARSRLSAINDPWCLQVFSDAAVAIDEWLLAGEFLNSLEQNSHGVQQAQARYMRGVSYQVSGRNDVALETLQMSANTAAIAPRAYWSMVSVDPDSVSVSQLEAMLDHPVIPEQDKRYLWQALGQKYHKQGEHENAFRCWQQASHLSEPLHPYSHTLWQAFFDQLKQGGQSSGPFIEDEGGAVGRPPVFIVGLPRSGSTLIEQLLVASGTVQALGELRDLEVTIQEVLDKNIRPAPFTLNSDDWSRVAQSSIAARYQRKIDSRMLPGMVPCDKNPANILWLGVILKAWPDAKIIHIHKSPEAACLGVYRQLFAAAAPWSYRLEDIAHYYQHYQSLLHFWQQQFPGRILDVSYEAFVESPRVQGQQIFNYLGLDWQDDLLAGIGQQTVNIPTASSSQVRAGLHAGYLNAWEPYKTQLEPFTRAIT